MADDSTVVAAAQEDDGRSTAQLIQDYACGPNLLANVVEGMTVDMMRERPVPGAMSTLEVISHVADCEQFLTDRMKRTIATERPLLVGVDGTTYLEALRYQDRNVALQLLLIEITRKQMAEDLARIPDDAWARTAIHTETGLVTLRQLLLHTVRHLERHVDAIKAKRRALGLD